MESTKYVHLVSEDTTLLITSVLPIYHAIAIKYVSFVLLITSHIKDNVIVAPNTAEDVSSPHQSSTTSFPPLLLINISNTPLALTAYNHTT